MIASWHSVGTRIGGKGGVWGKEEEGIAILFRDGKGLSSVVDVGSVTSDWDGGGGRGRVRGREIDTTGREN